MDCSVCTTLPINELVIGVIDQPLRETPLVNAAIKMGPMGIHLDLVFEGNYLWFGQSVSHVGIRYKLELGEHCARLVFPWRVYFLGRGGAP